EVVNVYRGSSRHEPVEPPTFHDNRLRVKRNDKYGYVNTSGKVVIPFQFENAFDFSDGVAIVDLGSHENYKDEKKKQSDSSLDKFYKSLPEGTSSASEYQWAVIDTIGTILYTFKKNERPDWETNFSNGLL